MGQGFWLLGRHSWSSTQISLPRRVGGPGVGNRTKAETGQCERRGNGSRPWAG